MKKRIGVCFSAIIFTIILIAGCTNQNTNNSGEKEKEETQIGDINITSSAFVNGGNIPIKYSCDGEDVSPPLSFNNVPELAESLVLIFDDPDAPVGTWVHWIVFNIPANTTGLEEDAITPYYIGTNSWGRIAYGGPCPPSGEEHRYYFRLYALDKILDLEDGASRQEVDAAMSGHIIGQTSLMGKYSS